MNQPNCFFLEPFFLLNKFLTISDRTSLCLCCKLAIYSLNHSTHFDCRLSNFAMYLTPCESPFPLYTSSALVRYKEKEFKWEKFLFDELVNYPLSSFYLKFGECGWGVYTKMLIKEGEDILYYTGQLINKEELLNRRQTYDDLVYFPFFLPFSCETLFFSSP